MISVRRARIEDARSIAQVHVASVEGISTSLYTAEEIESWSRPRTIANYEELIRTREFLVAEAQNGIVGFGVLNRSSSVIEAVYVAPVASGRGIGMELMRELEARAASLGLKQLQLNASLNAVPFYRKAGYSGDAQQKYKLQTGVEIACVPMSKTI
jgi:N-acetylglutamate synthase-like GNAT family acetyltransferase